MNLATFWTDVKNAEHSFTKWASTLWADVQKEEPKIAAIIDDGLNYVGPALQMVVTQEAGSAAGAAVASAIASVQSKLKAVSGLVHDFGADTTVAQVIQTAQNDVNQVKTIGNLGTKSVGILSRVEQEIGVLFAAISKAAQPAKA